MNRMAWGLVILTITPKTDPKSMVLNLPQKASATKAPTTGAKLDMPE